MRLSWSRKFQAYLPDRYGTRCDDDESTAEWRTIYAHFPQVARALMHANVLTRVGPETADGARDIGPFRAWIVRASRMSYREIGRSAQNSIKLFHPRGKEGTGAQGEGEQGRRTIMAGIELSALNSAFYACRATARSPCQRRRMETL